MTSKTEPHQLQNHHHKHHHQAAAITVNHQFPKLPFSAFIHHNSPCTLHHHPSSPQINYLKPNLQNRKHYTMNTSPSQSPIQIQSANSSSHSHHRAAREEKENQMLRPS
jgi:hypothetical protein